MNTERYENFKNFQANLDLGSKKQRDIAVQGRTLLDYPARINIQETAKTRVFEYREVERYIDIDLKAGDPGVDELCRPDGVVISVIKSPSGKRYSLFDCIYVYGIRMQDEEAREVFNAVNDWHEKQFGERLPQLANAQGFVTRYKTA